jgi:hypothetical protein
MSTEIDSVLSGIIVLLLIIVVWKWYGSRSSCGQSYGALSCGCKQGQCRCRRMSGGSMQMHGMHNDSRNQPRYMQRGNYVRDNMNGRDGMTVRDGMDGTDNGESRVTSSGPRPVIDSELSQEWQNTVAEIGVDKSVGDSHKDWCNSLTINGMSTGASACTTLEETGRSYGSANFHGLTARKWCKARQLATPASDARTTPSHLSDEYCDIAMDEII